MSRKRVLIAVMSGVLALLVLNTVIAGSLTVNTPLYRVRMEQASSEMNFLPTAVNNFTYTAEQGYILNCRAAGCDGIPLGITEGKTCDGTCQGQVTCQGYNTCDLTCWSTCPNTCGNTCPLTCDTCDQTCATCEGTCQGTCITCIIPLCNG